MTVQPAKDGRRRWVHPPRGVGVELREEGFWTGGGRVGDLERRNFPATTCDVKHHFAFANTVWVR